MSDEDFEGAFPPWADLDDEVRRAKVDFTRDDLLALIDRAGYAVVRKRVTP